MIITYQRSATQGGTWIYQRSRPVRDNALYRHIVPAVSERLANSTEADLLMHQDLGYDLDVLLTDEGTEVPGLLSRTALTERPVDETLGEIFRDARHEEFEVGMKSTLAEKLGELLKSHESTIFALAGILDSGAADPETASETLRWLGEVEHTESRAERRALLERTLTSVSARRRYAATLGLAVLKDRESIPALRAAYDREPNSKIRRTIQQALKQLGSAGQWQHS